MKTKGQPSEVAKLEPLALVSLFGGLAGRSNATGLHPADDYDAVQGFESLTRRQTITSPTRSANCGQGLNLGLAPETELSKLTAIVRPLPKKRKVHIDEPQLPNRRPVRAETIYSATSAPSRGTPVRVPPSSIRPSLPSGTALTFGGSSIGSPRPSTGQAQRSAIRGRWRWMDVQEREPAKDRPD